MIKEQVTWKKNSLSLLWDPLIAQTYFKDLFVQYQGFYAPQISISLEEKNHAFLPIL